MRYYSVTLRPLWATPWLGELEGASLWDGGLALARIETHPPPHIAHRTAVHGTFSPRYIRQGRRRRRLPTTTRCCSSYIRLVHMSLVSSCCMHNAAVHNDDTKSTRGRAHRHTHPARRARLYAAARAALRKTPSHTIARRELLATSPGHVSYTNGRALSLELQLEPFFEHALEGLYYGSLVSVAPVVLH